MLLTQLRQRGVVAATLATTDLAAYAHDAGHGGAPPIACVFFTTLVCYLRSETTEPAYAERQSASALDLYAFQLLGWLKTEGAKSRKQRRSLKQLLEDLSKLGFGDLTIACRRSPGNGGRVKRSGSIQRANEQSIRLIYARKLFYVEY
jgi:hypothetical protein